MNLFCSCDEIALMCVEFPDDAGIPYTADMAIRAREILTSKTDIQIYDCATVVSYAVMNYLLNIDHGEALLDVAEGRENDEYWPESRSISDVRALKNDIFQRFGELDATYFIHLRHDDEATWRPEEMFAVLTLILLIKSIRIYALSNPDITDEVFWETLELLDIREDEEVSVRAAAQASLAAMECINYAERLKRGRERIELDQRQRSEVAQKLNGARHAERDEAKNRVLAEWLGKTDEFPSAAKAGNHYANWLSQQGMKSYEPTTVIKWIRDCAKQEKIRLR